MIATEIVSQIMSENEKSRNDGFNSRNYSPDILLVIVNGMLTLPCPITGKMGEYMPEEIMEEVRDYQYHNDSHCGWVDREGKFYGCGYAKHEKLLYWLDKTNYDVEMGEGWIRVGGRYPCISFQSTYRLSPQQKRFLDKRDIAWNPEHEMTLPVFRRDG